MTIRELLDNISERFENAHIYYGHGTDNAFDEAVNLVFYVLNIPFDIFYCSDPDTFL